MFYICVGFILFHDALLMVLKVIRTLNCLLLTSTKQVVFSQWLHVSQRLHVWSIFVADLMKIFCKDKTRPKDQVIRCW